MSEIHSNRLALTRRGFLGGTAATIGISALPSGAFAYQAKYRRYEISDPAMPANILPSYKAAITAMLALPATDPRNWHRNAMVHLLDCPHGNWWFLPWHRGYLGWLEQTCRELSQDADFTLPYWDWTKTPRVPAAMFDGVLDPNNAAFIPTSAQFQTNFQAAITTLYASFTADQNAQLAKRPSVTTETGFWNNALSAYSDQPNARGLTAANPDFDPFTQTTVAIGMIRSALQVQTFSGNTAAAPGFGSRMTAAHSSGSSQGILESQPHNNVHGAVGGLMGNYLSSIDPIFFLHHGNIDRLWDVWTRRQLALGRPTLPEGADLTTWSDEPFLFFSGADGLPAPKTKAGDYAEMTVFDYDYSPGSGEDEVPAVVAAAPMAAAAPAPAVSATIAAASGEAAGGVAEVPRALLAAAAIAEQPVVAVVTLNLGEHDAGRRFQVLVTLPGATEPVLAGAITVFGHPHAGENTFSVPLPRGVAIASAAAAAESVPLDIRVEEIPSLSRPAAAAAALGAAPVAAIEVTTQ